jgi:hypothetical protein
MSSSVNSNGGKPSSHIPGTFSQSNRDPSPAINLSGEEQPIKIEPEAAPVTLSANKGQKKEKHLGQPDDDSSTTDGGAKRTGDENGHEETHPKKAKKKVDIRQPDVSLIPQVCLNRNDSDAEAFIESPEASACLPSGNRICFERQQAY